METEQIDLSSGSGDFEPSSNLAQTAFLSLKEELRVSADTQGFCLILENSMTINKVEGCLMLLPALPWQLRGEGRSFQGQLQADNAEFGCQ